MHVYDLWSADGCSVLIVTKFVISSMQLFLWVEGRQMLLNTVQQILLLTSCFPNRYIIQLEFCHSKIRAVIIPKKKSSRTNPEVGACDNRCEVTTPYSKQT